MVYDRFRNTHYAYFYVVINYLCNPKGNFYETIFGAFFKNPFVIYTNDKSFAYR